jgi:hypothetical protein
LRGISAGAIVDAVAIALLAGVSATGALLTTTAATAAVISLTIVHQGLYVLSTQAVRRSNIGSRMQFTCAMRLARRIRVPWLPDCSSAHDYGVELSLAAHSFSGFVLKSYPAPALS